MRIETAEYERMRSWLGYMVLRVFPSDLLTPETDPLAVLDRTASKSPARGRSGLAMAIEDVVELTSGWLTIDVAKCDSELSLKGLPTLTEVRARSSKVVQRVIRSGRITSDEEFFALRNAVEQQGANSEALWTLLTAYETAKTSS